MIHHLKAFLHRLRHDRGKKITILRKAAIVLFILFFTMIFAVSMLFISVWAGWFGKLPSQRELASVENQLSSEIYAQRGKLLGKYFYFDRSHVSKEQISENVFNCLLATEDARFYKHRGTDIRSLGRVLVKNFMLGQRSAGGGSTITQQLAKNLFMRSQNGVFSMPVNKIREMIIARRLEKVYTKDDILVLYLNTVPFGENVYGISAASLRFFNKNPRDLKIEEAAVLIGMLKATSYFNPRLQPERATGRRNVVISQLVKYEYLNEQAADSIANRPLKLTYNPITHNQGPAPYFRETVRLQLMKILADYNVRNGTDYNLYTDGLKIYTTINYDLQLMAETAVKSQLSRQQKTMDAYFKNVTAGSANALLKTLMKNSKRYKALVGQKLTEKQIEEDFKKVTPMELFSWEGPMRVETTPLDSIYRMQQVLHAGLVSMDPANGHVRAWVGGNDYRYFQYDHVLSKRQAGSAFKPFLYATALSSGIDPCEYISNEQRVYEEYDDWSPTNVRNEYDGFFSMTGALANSINTVSAHYISRVGPQAVAETARVAGIHSPLMAVPSLALGTANVSLLEITAAYSVFLNEGVAVEPIWLLKVEDKNGKVLYQRKEESTTHKALPSDVAMMTRQMLQAVVDSGTARSLRYNFGLYGPLAGKTGTTQNSADTWFVGFSPGLITGVWTGVENPGFAQIYKTPLGSGSSAVPVWGDYYAQISRHTATQRFTSGSFSALPDSLLARLNCSMYLDQLPSESWWDTLFGPSDPEERSRRREVNENKKGRIKRWLESIF